jgi:hypothetical protein
VLGEDDSLQAAGGVDLCAGKVELAVRGGISVNVTVRHGEAAALTAGQPRRRLRGLRRRGRHGRAGREVHTRRPWRG